MINSLPEQWLCLLLVHLIMLTLPIFWMVSMTGIYISDCVIFQKLSTVYRLNPTGCVLHFWNVPCNLRKSLMKLGLRRLQLCSLTFGILTLLVLASCGFVQMDSANNVNLCWLSGSGIIKNKLLLLKWDMAYNRLVKFWHVCQQEDQYLDRSIIQQIRECTQRNCSTILSMLCTL